MSRLSLLAALRLGRARRLSAGRRRPTVSAVIAQTLETRAMLSADAPWSDPDHGPAGVDFPFGVFTGEEVEALENVPASSENSSKTPPAAAATFATGAPSDDILTFVLDFKEPGQGSTFDVFSNEVTEFDVTSFGFAAGDFDTVAEAVLAEVKDDYFTELIGTTAGPTGQDLEVDFIIGDIGTAPAGISEYYFIQIGTGVAGPHSGGTLGVASGSGVRVPGGGGGPRNVGDVVGSVFTDTIQSLSGVGTALSSGNLAATTFGISGTLSHEIGHTVSLTHINRVGSVQPTAGRSPIMGTGAIDLPNADRITDREFSISGVDGEDGNAPRRHIDQLVSAVGLHFTSPASVGGVVFEDFNGDGVRDAGEPAFPGGVTVFADENFNGSFDTGERSDVTDAAGAYDLEFFEPAAVVGETTSGAAFEVTNFAVPPASPPEVVITEVSEQTPDFFEIQNVSGAAADTTGWFLAASLGNDGDGTINNVHPNVFSLPASLAAGEVLVTTDNAGLPNFWGSNLNYTTGIRGWVLLIDDNGDVRDAFFAGYPAEVIAGFNVTVGGVSVTAADVDWIGDGVPVVTNGAFSHQRVGSFDSNSASGFTTQAVSRGTANSGLATVFGNTPGRFGVSGLTGGDTVSDLDIGLRSVNGYDFGDAPASYGTLIADDGPSHRVGSLFLGGLVDEDGDGQPSAAANLDFDDGVFFQSDIETGSTADVDVFASAAGELTYWIDFDGSGTFDPSERFTETLASGVNGLSFAVPAGAAVGSTYARFRFSSTSVTSPTGPAADGEVEDYLVTVTAGVSDPDDTIAEANANGAFAFDTPVSADLDNVDDVDLYRIDVAAGDVIGIDLDSPEEFDSFVRLFDAGGVEIASNDDGLGPLPEGAGPDGLDSYLEQTFFTAGTFYVGVSNFGLTDQYDPVTGVRTGFGDAAGAYTITFHDLADPDDQISEAPPLAVGGTAAGVIDAAEDVDVYAVTTTAAGQFVAFDVDADFDAALRLFDSAGTPLALDVGNPGPFEPAVDNEEPFLNFEFITPGTYYVSVSGAPNVGYDPLDGTGDVAGETGSYTLNVFASSDSPVIDRLNAEIRFNENSRPINFARSARVFDDLSDYGGAVLRVEAADVAASGDNLVGLVDADGVTSGTGTFGAGSGQVTIARPGLGDVPVGDVDYGGDHFEITFLPGTTRADVVRVLRTAAYQNTSDTPSDQGTADADGSIFVTLTAADGVPSLPVSSGVNLVSIADNPAIAGVLPDAVWTEGGGPVPVTGPAVTVTDSDTTDFGGARLDVVVRTPRDVGDVFILDVAADADVTVDAAGPGATVSVLGAPVATLSRGTAASRMIIDFLAGATAADVGRLARLIRFDSANDAPRGPKTFRFTLTDPDGGRGVAQEQLTVNTTNDLPAILNVAGRVVNATEAGPAVRLASSFAISDPDFAGGGGVLRLSIPAAASAQDTFTILPGGNVTLSGMDVVFAGTTIGTVAGLGTNLMTITFNGSATVAGVRSVGRQVAYQALSGVALGSVNVDFDFTDEAGGAAPTARMTVLVSGASPTQSPSSSAAVPAATSSVLRAASASVAEPLVTESLPSDEEEPGSVALVDEAVTDDAWLASL